MPLLPAVVSALERVRQYPVMRVFEQASAITLALAIPVGAVVWLLSPDTLISWPTLGATGAVIGATLLCTHIADRVRGANLRRAFPLSARLNVGAFARPEGSDVLVTLTAEALSPFALSIEPGGVVSVDIAEEGGTGTLRHTPLSVALPLEVAGRAMRGRINLPDWRFPRGSLVQGRLHRLTVGGSLLVAAEGERVQHPFNVVFWTVL